MSDLRYDVVLTGNLLDGFTLEHVKRNLVELLELTEHRIGELLQQQHAVLARNLDYQGASRFLERLVQAGVETYLVRHGHAPAITAVKGTVSPPAAADRLVIDDAQARATAFAFTGQGSEYFRIWIVNLLLTLATLGIYSAWAKVRNKQYFYGNTQLDGASFAYRARPMQILKGRLLAFAIFVLYLALSYVYAWVDIVFGLALLGAFPWLLVRSLAFNAHYSAYRNVAFAFDGRYGGAFAAFIGWPMLGLLSLGIVFPLAVYKQQVFLVRHHRYGDTTFSFEPGVAAYYIVFLTLIGMAFALAILLGLISVVLPAELAVAAMIVLPLLMYLWLFVYFSVAVTNLRYNHARLGLHAFHSTLATPSYFRLILINTLLTVVTLGLFLPWARVRTARYKAAHLDVLAKGSLDRFSASVEQRVEAFGEGMSDVFDMDIGL